jgi:hypothetical protein
MIREEVSLGELISGLKIQLVVTGVARARIRLWLGLRIIRLGAWVTGCGFETGFTPRV